jgi:hypothetical protein
MANNRATSDAIKDVEELCGYVTTREAAKIVGLEWPTMSQVVYSKRVKAVRIGGIILVEKASAEKYKLERQQMMAQREQERAERASKESERERDKALREKLKALTPEQLEALLSQVEVKA